MHSDAYSVYIYMRYIVGSANADINCMISVSLLRCERKLRVVKKLGISYRRAVVWKCNFLCLAVLAVQGEVLNADFFVKFRNLRRMIGKIRRKPFALRLKRSGKLFGRVHFFRNGYGRGVRFGQFDVTETDFFRLRLFKQLAPSADSSCGDICEYVVFHLMVPFVYTIAEYSESNMQRLCPNAVRR